MVPQMERPRVTEIKVRIDCNGCVQKIKKALNGITGIYDINIDISQQKITIMGWADPEKLLKAIKKTRKSAVICLNTEQSIQQVQATQPTPEDKAAPLPKPSNPPQKEAAPPPNAPNEQPELEYPPPESFNPTGQSHQDFEPRNLEQVGVIYDNAPDYGYQYGGPRSIYVAHSYNTYKPPPYITEYTFPRSPPQYSFYSGHSQDYYKNYGNSNIISMFSEENPNACTIV